MSQSKYDTEVRLKQKYVTAAMPRYVSSQYTRPPERLAKPAILNVFRGGAVFVFIL
jgi:hypothetical protein